MANKKKVQVDIVERVILPKLEGLGEDLKAHVDENGIIHIVINDQPVNSNHLVTIEAEVPNGKGNITVLVDCDPDTGEAYYIEVVIPSLLQKILLKQFGN